MARLWISALFAAVVSTVAVISGAVADAAPLAHRAALSSVVVPDLRGLQYPDAARQAARAAGLAVCPVHRTDGIVVDQTPLPGETSTFPNCIEVTVVDAVRVPGLVGATLNDARDRLQSVKLVLAQPATVAGTVASQTPVADTLAAVGTTVTVTMTGPDKVSVPDLLGRTVGDAQALLLDAGLRLRNGGSDRSRRIATQNPPPGAKVARGTRVSVTLQPPVRVVSVPDLRGMTLDQARAALTDAGLVLANLSTDSGHDAHVTAQSPTAGAQVPPGSQVTVTLDVAPPPNGGGLGGELAGGAVVLALVTFGGVALRLRRRAPSQSSDSAQSTNRRPLAVRLVPRPDPARDVRVLSSHDLAHARLGLEPHVDPTVDPDLVEVSS